METPGEMPAIDAKRNLARALVGNGRMLSEELGLAAASGRLI